MTKSPNGTLKLADHHKMMLMAGSAITENVIEQRGYSTITTPDQAKELGFNRSQCRVVSERYPALIIPYHGPDGNFRTYCMRPDNPRVVEQKKKGKLPDGTYPQKTFKYEMIKGAGNVLDCHPAIVPHLSDPARPLVFTEGAKKEDSLVSKEFLAVNVNGVWGWRGSNDQQGKTALADFELIALNGRKCYLLFDSDVRDNDYIKSALRRFKSFLESKGACAVPVFLPPTAIGKIGVDDFFASGKTAQDLDSLFAYFETFAADLGGSGAKKHWTTEQHIDLYRGWNYIFAINDMNEALELNGSPMNDTKSNIIEARLRDEKIPIEHAKNSMFVYGNANRYHPIKNYLQSLKWNENDHITKLADHFTDQDTIFFRWLKRWLIGAVAKVMGDGDNQNFVLALDGRQGIGKSYFAHWICPLPRYFLESPLDPDDKDTLIRLMSNWIWEIGELGSVTRKPEQEALKRVISMRHVTVRAPYGHFDITKPAIASFIGTVNDEGAGFLNDSTGNRRYASCTITKINWDYTKLDVNQIWAQVYHLYQKGEPWELKGEEAKTRDEINRKYEVEDPLLPLILQHFEITKSDEDRLTGPEILSMLDLKKDNPWTFRRLAAVLRSLGVEQTNPLKIEGQEQKARFYVGIKYT